MAKPSRWVDAQPHKLMALAAAAVLVVFGVLVTTTRYLVAVARVDGTAADMWSVLGSVSAAAAVSITIGGGLLLWAQLEQSRRERSRAAFTESFMLLMTDDQIEARRWIYGLPDDVDDARRAILATPENHRRYKQVLNALDYLGFLIEFHPGSDREVIEWTSPFVCKTWAKLGPLVEAEADRRGEPSYYRAARRLAARCAARRARGGGAEADGFLRVEDAL